MNKEDKTFIELCEDIQKQFFEILEIMGIGKVADWLNEKLKGAEDAEN